MNTDVHRGALDAIERLLNRGGEPDDVLRAVVGVLHERLPHLERVWIEFIERDGRVVGPTVGESASQPARTFPVRFQAADVAALAVPERLLRNHDADLLERVATIIAPYCLVGWDTGGEPWAP